MNRKYGLTRPESTIDPVLAQCTATNSTPVIEIDTPILKGGKLTAALKRAGLHVIVIDHAPVYNKETLLHALYQNTPFPGYFGFNWDALQDVLADFSWLKDTPNGIVLLLKNASRFKAEASEDWETFVDIVNTVSGVWAKKRRLPFHLVVAK